MSDASAGSADQAAAFRQALAEVGLDADQETKVREIFGRVQSGQITPGGGAVLREVAGVLRPDQVAALRQKLGR